MAVNYNNDRTVLYSGDVNTMPDKFQLLTGTLTTSGKFVTGVGSLFLSEIGGDAGVGAATIVGGDLNNGWLFDGSGEVRRITGVTDNTHLVLEAGFTLDIVAGRIIKYVKPSRSKQMSYVVISGTVIVDGVSMTSAEGSGWGDTAHGNTYTVDPVIVDTSAGILHLTKMIAN